MKITFLILGLISFQFASAQSDSLDISKLAPGTYYYVLTGFAAEPTGRLVVGKP